LLPRAGVNKRRAGDLQRAAAKSFMAPSSSNLTYPPVKTVPKSWDGTVVAKLNRIMVGWANYFCLGPVSKAYRAVERHARRRLRQWLCAKHKLPWPSAKQYPDAALHAVLGLIYLTKKTHSFPWAKP